MPMRSPFLGPTELTRIGSFLLLAAFAAGYAGRTGRLAVPDLMLGFLHGLAIGCLLLAVAARTRSEARR